MKSKLTTNTGSPVANNQHAMTAGPRGPQLLQDGWFLEKLAHFGREVIAERDMHTKGAGAYGTFTVTHDITKFTKANIFSEIGKKTELFTRFTTVAGEHGCGAAERDIRGFAVKFYSEEGNWDMLGNNTPVFFLRDPLKSPHLNYGLKHDLRTNLRSAQSNWDFWTSLPETFHQVTIAMSDRGLPASYRHMHGFGSHTFSMINAHNKRVWVKFHFKSKQGIKNLTASEAEQLIDQDSESYQADLYRAIEQGDNPKWTLKIQVMTEEQAEKSPFNPFDLTKVWPHFEYPLIEVGTMELNRNPEDCFAEGESSAFNPANIVPGISFSPDKMLQGRLSPYGNVSPAQGNLESSIDYEQSRYGEWQQQTEYSEPTLQLGQWDHRQEQDYFSQAGDLFRMMSEVQRQALFANTASSIADESMQVKKRHIYHCLQADRAYGVGVAKALNVELDH